MGTGREFIHQRIDTPTEKFIPGKISENFIIFQNEVYSLRLLYWHFSKTRQSTKNPQDTSWVELFHRQPHHTSRSCDYKEPVCPLISSPSKKKQTTGTWNFQCWKYHWGSGKGHHSMVHWPLLSNRQWTVQKCTRPFQDFQTAAQALETSINWHWNTHTEHWKLGGVETCH